MPYAANAIGETLDLKLEGNQQFIYNWRKLFLVPTPISIDVRCEPSKAVVSYNFSLKNPIFLSAMIVLAAAIVGVNNFKTATYLLAAAAIAAAVAIIAAAAVAAAESAAPAAPEQDKEDQDDPDPAAVIVGTEHGVIPFPALYSQRPPRADQVRREPVRQRKRSPPLSAYTMSIIRRV